VRGAVLGLLIASVASGQTTQAAPAGAPGACTCADCECALVSALDALHLRRDEPQALLESHRLASSGLAEFPSSYAIAWRAARLEVWVADSAEADAVKKSAARKAWTLGDAAVKLNPDAAEGHYYAAAGVGLFGQAMGVMTAISEGVAGKFNERLDRAIAIDPAVEGGGPWVARGRYFYEVPFFMRDLKKSAEFLSKAIARHPENLRARLYLAQTLLKDGQAKKARAVIEQVVSGDESYDPPDARRVKKAAAQTEKEIAEALKD
jgi:hypothetical protein